MGGTKHMIINNRERAVSGDINRAQAFLAAAQAQAARAVVNADLRGGFYAHPGLVVPYASVPAAPPADYLVPHDCVSGLMVRPDNAAYLLVDGGAASFFAPAYQSNGAALTSDDSPYITVADPGVASTTALTWLANAGPGVRWDVVECQPVEELLESASRDIYSESGPDPWVPAVVEKVRAPRLTYRIRRGVAGAGVPPPDPEWMPLALVHVRTDATGFNNSDLYDVRPLVAERCPFSPRHPLSVPSGGALYRVQLFESCFSGVPATVPALGMEWRGYFRGHFGGYWSGGVLRRNTPAANLADFGASTSHGGERDAFLCDDPANQSSAGLTGSDEAIFTLGAYFPQSYPRWVRYSQSLLSAVSSNRLRVTGRLPQGPRGVLVLTDQYGGLQANGLLSNRQMPTAFGEVAGAWGHVVGHATRDAVGNDFYPPISVGAGEFHFAAVGANTVDVAGISTAAGLEFFTVDVPLSRTYPIPPWASAVLLSFDLAITHGASVGTVDFEAFLCFGTTSGRSLPVPLPFASPIFFQAAPTTLDFTFQCWVPLWPSTNYDSSAGNAAVLSFVGTNDNYVSAVSATCQVIGYRV